MHAKTFRGFTAPGKLRSMFLDTKRHREMYVTQFYRLHNTKQVKIEVFRGKIQSS